MSASDPGAVAGHEVAGVDATGLGYLIRCVCGWSAVRTDQAELIDRWTDHRSKMQFPLAELPEA